MNEDIYLISSFMTYFLGNLEKKLLLALSLIIDCGVHKQILPCYLRRTVCFYYWIMTECIFTRLIVCIARFVLYVLMKTNWYLPIWCKLE